MASPSGAGFPDWVFCRRTGGPTEPVFGFEREVLPPRLLFVELKGGRKGAKPKKWVLNAGDAEGGGVVPDETQPLTIAGLAAGRDEAMNAALAWIDRQHK